MVGIFNYYRQKIGEDNEVRGLSEAEKKVNECFQISTVYTVTLTDILEFTINSGGIFTNKRQHQQPHTSKCGTQNEGRLEMKTSFWVAFQTSQNKPFDFIAKLLNRDYEIEHLQFMAYFDLSKCLT